MPRGLEDFAVNQFRLSKPRMLSFLNESSLIPEIQKIGSSVPRASNPVRTLPGFGFFNADINVSLRPISIVRLLTNATALLTAGFLVIA
jgi:hypothetical protein